MDASNPFVKPNTANATEAARHAERSVVARNVETKRQGEFHSPSNRVASVVRAVAQKNIVNVIRTAVSAVHIVSV